MPQFQLDTSGGVFAPGSSLFDPITRNALVIWTDLAPFTQGYIEALFFSEAASLQPRDGMGAPLDGCADLGFSDLAPETLARIIEDCERWLEDMDPAIRDVTLKMCAKEAGADLWPARSEGKFPTQFPPLTPYLGDDGKVYLS